MISDVSSFAEYYERVYQRTLEVARAVPPRRYDWSPRPGELTAAGVIRHIGSTGVMNARRVAGEPLRYPGHGEALGPPVEYLASCHQEVLRVLTGMPPTRLSATIETLRGTVEGWRLLLNNVEHEVHHRSQLCGHLSELGIEPPALFGVHMEELPT
jgi:uncharacterized damage-inducible protein DinB